MGDDLLHMVSGERLDVDLSQFLEEEFVAQPTRGFTSAFLLAAEDGEVDSGMPQQFHQRPRHPLRPAIIRTGAAHPVKQLEARVIFDGWNTDGLRPVGALGRGQAPGIAAGLHSAQAGRSGAAEGALADAVPAHVGDERDWINTDRADARTRAAGGAGPESFELDRLLVQRARRIRGG